MANTFVKYTGDGVTNTYSIPFGYISASHVKVLVAGVEVAFTFNNSSTALLAPTPTAGLLIVIKRVTPSSPLVDFTDGSTLFEYDLDLSAQQNRYIAEEAVDIAADALALDGADNKYDADSKVIKNLANPVNAQDAATKYYLENTWLSVADKAQLNALNTTKLHGVYDDLANVNTVADDLNGTDTVGTVAGIAGNVTTVAGISGNVTTVGTNNANVSTVAGISGNVTTVAGISANVTTVAGNTSNINAAVANQANINAAVADAVDIGIVASNIANVNIAAGNTTNINAAVANTSNINAVVADAADIGAVASNIANVNTVATNDANVTTVAGINANVTTVAGISADVSTVSGISGNVTTVVGIAANVTAVANNETNINIAANNIGDVNSFVNKYRVSSSAPATSLDSGDLWWNTTANELRAYNSSLSVWAATAPTAANQAAIDIVAGDIVYSEDLGSITAAVTTGTGNSITTVGDDIASVITVAGSIANVNSTAGSIANVNLVGGSVANVNTVASNIADVNNFASQYRISASAPSSPSFGDLWYDSTANTLKYYTGSIFAAISAGIASISSDPTPALGGTLDAANNNLTNVGTISGSNLQLDFGGL